MADVRQDIGKPGNRRKPTEIGLSDFIFTQTLKLSDIQCVFFFPTAEMRDKIVPLLLLKLQECG